jgi:hypothetical protein
MFCVFYILRGIESTDALHVTDYVDNYSNTNMRLSYINVPLVS